MREYSRSYTTEKERSAGQNLAQVGRHVILQQTLKANSAMKLTQLLQPFLARHWFKLCIVFFLLFLLFQKELSFRVQFNAPVQHETPATSPMVAQKRSVLTDSKTAPAVTDRLQLFGGGDTSGPRLATSVLEQTDEREILAFINRFVHVAETEQEKFGIPASLILAQALLSSYAGTRDICQSTNNLFALPCTADWQGAKETANAHCFRAYDNAWMSFRDHSYFLTTGSRTYLKDLGNTDYAAWAKELEKAGYTPEKNWAKQLTHTIEQYGLAQYDK